MALPVDPRIEAALVAARGRVVGGNTSREQLALRAALGLTTSGLFETAGIAEAGRAGAGFAEAPELENLTYQVNPAHKGRAFRQAFGAIDASAASRGAAYGSGRVHATIQTDRELLGQAQAAIRAFTDAQNASVAEQGQGLDELARSIAEIRFEQGREAREAAPAAEPAAQPVYPANVPPHARGPGATPNRGGHIITDLRRSDLSPGVLSSLSASYPNHKVVISGNGRVVLKKIR